MGSTAISEVVSGTVPHGLWTVDAAPSSLEFTVRGGFGLVPVRGRFVEFEGELYAEESRTQGELRINTASVYTRSERRDAHLRSPAFFDVERNPLMTFWLAGVETTQSGPIASGALQIGRSRVDIAAPLTVLPLGTDRLVLEADIAVDRAEAGLAWNRMGLIRGLAHLHAKLTLEPGEQWRGSVSQSLLGVEPRLI